MKVPFYYWIFVFLYSIIILLSNFGESKVFSVHPYGFAFWFVILFLAAGFGFIISYFFKLNRALWIVTLVFLSVTFISSFLALVKPSLLLFDDISLSRLIVQILKMALASFFGLAGVLIWQNIFLAKELLRADEKIKFYERNVLDAKREAEILKKEAEVKADEMILDAKKKVQELEKLRRELEIKLREFLQIEMSVLEKHEESLRD